MICRRIGISTFYLVEMIVAVVDGGTPRRGDVANINLTISETCLYDVLGDPIETLIYTNETTGGLFLRVPKYYLFEYGEKLLIIYTFLNFDFLFLFGRTVPSQNAISLTMVRCQVYNIFCKKKLTFCKYNNQLTTCRKTGKE